MADFLMPSLGADMDEGTVLEWRVSVGDTVRRGDVIVDIDTDKAAFEVESELTGVVEAILVEPDTTVPVGTVMARIATAEADHRAASPAAAPEAPAAGPGPVPAETQQRAAGASGTCAPAASPLARRRAAELGVKLESIERGTGVAGSIRVRDVELAAARQQGAEEGGESRQQRLRSVIASAMSRSKREIPHYYLAHAVDLEPALGWLENYNAARPITERVLINALLLKAAVNALIDVPELNGHWSDGRAVKQERVNLAVAVSLRGGGVIAPVIHDAAALSLPALMSRLNDLVKRARAGRLRHAEMVDATITVTSLGERGADTVYGVIFPPQVALVGFGTVAQRPWAAERRLEVRRAVTATLSADHRASDGHRGALYLRAIARQLEQPEAL